jgi:hypothetical protein
MGKTQDLNKIGRTLIMRAESLSVIKCPKCHAPSSDVACVKCKFEFSLTSTLAQPYIEEELAKVHQESREQSAALKKREQELALRLKSLDTLESSLNTRATEIDAAVEQTLRKEREALTRVAEKKASDTYAAKLRAAEQELAEKQARLSKAEQDELAIRKERRALEDDKRKLELEIARRLDEERRSIRESTQREEEINYRLKIAEKDKIIADIQKQVEELRRKGDQTSQQLQGEVAELELESALRAAFPTDQIEAVEKGRIGGDVIHKVLAPGGLPCGIILWESKRTQRWSNEWLQKNRADQRTAAARIGVIVSTAMPRNMEGFGRLENVWVCTMRYALALAVALRLILIETSIAKTAAQGRDGKMERMYEYLTGVQFRAHVSSIVEACVLMQEDDEAEVRVFNKQAGKTQAPQGTPRDRGGANVGRPSSDWRAVYSRTAGSQCAVPW